MPRTPGNSRCFQAQVLESLLGWWFRFNFTPSEKYAHRQNGKKSSPKVRDENKTIFELPPPSFGGFFLYTQAT